MHSPSLSRAPLATAIQKQTQRQAVLPRALLTTLLLLGAGEVLAAPTNVNIPAQPLSSALQQLGQQANLQMIYSPEMLQGLKSNAVSGNLEPEQALHDLLLGSGLTYQITGNTVSLTPITGAAGDAMQLGAISISGKAPGSQTEGTGLYTTYSSSSSTRLNLTPRETPQSVTVITRQRLDDQKLTNLTDVLDATAGIAVTRNGMGTENDTYWSRGSQIQNFEVDGVPTSTRLDNYTQSTAMYDRVEVVRGATGLISGLGNPSATINLIRKRPTAEAQASVTAEAGNWDRYGTGMDVSGPLTESGNVRGRLVVDYKTQGSWVDRFKQDSQLIYGITEFDLSEATLLTVGFSYQKTQVDSPMRGGYSSYFTNGDKSHIRRSLNTSPDWSYNDHDQTNFFTSVEHQFDNGWSGKIEYGHTENKFDQLYAVATGTVDQANGSGTGLLPVRWSGTPRQDNIDAYFTGPFSLFGREHELILGVTATNYKEATPSYGDWLRDYSFNVPDINTWNGNSPKPDTPVVSKGHMEEKQFGTYMTSRFHVTDDLTFILGGRLTDWKRDTDTKPYVGDASTVKERETGIFTPYTGVVYDLDENWSLYASYTKIFNPQASYVRDINNKSLAPTEGKGYEVGVKGTFFDEKLNTSLALFKLEQDNLAVWMSDTQAYRLEQSTETKGVEFEMNGELAEGWQASAGYAYSVTTNAEDQRIVTNAPRHMLKTFTSYRLPGVLDKITVGGGVNWQSKIGEDLHYYEQGSYAITNLMARYDINKNLSASINVNNLFDREYYSMVYYDGIYGAPRNFMTSLKYSF
ncbi:TonB-dependent siderophore receptor [Pseudomonas sp. DTU12.3]|uniref:Outer-membrane receptor for ferric coprogen and ferric-rhodotorulic acid n=1 Tax=Pseudomonas helmanticensis TaxID=1471381 RepID=A0ACD2U425_9PSED|nr:MULTISPECIES: TonB-dependent siderophore receptor [Pseudomonas]QAX84359.1 TonB-dependent siderophore receptor [Pseudomonas sp. DTU12.3]SMQ25044.1 outer-membrane receptor for ferric coprogen and ferric-rhodotorulic acid [Pseudomonas helmanticensis]